MNVLPEGRIPFRGASTWYRTSASIPQWVAEANRLRGELPARQEAA